MLAFVGLLIWQVFLAPVDKYVPATYDQFVLDVRAGRVEEVRLDGNEVRYRVHLNDRTTVTKGTTAPSKEQAIRDARTIDAPNAVAPKLVVER